MAVCLAVVADNSIVVCSDESADPPLETTDEVIQDRQLPYGFRVLVAAPKATGDAISDALIESFTKLGANRDFDVNQAVHLGLRSYKQLLLDEYFDLKYGLTYESFRRGAHLFPEASHMREVEKARDTDLNAELLIVGFVKGEPLLLTVHSDWEVTIDEKFGAIGKSAEVAAISLLARGGDELDRPLDETIYSLYEAKRVTEKLEGVSEQTVLTVYGGDGTIKQISAQVEAHLSKLYATYGPRPLSGELGINDLISP